jgi:hypothetical protein
MERAASPPWLGAEIRMPRPTFRKEDDYQFIRVGIEMAYG